MIQCIGIYVYIILCWQLMSVALLTTQILGSIFFDLLREIVRNVCSMKALECVIIYSSAHSWLPK